MRRTILYAVMLLVTVLIFAPTTSANKPHVLGPNLVINGTMEKPSPSFVGLPYFFQYDTNSRPEQVMQSSAQAYSGTKSLKITTVGIGVGVTADAISEWMYRPIGPTDGDLYTVGFWLYKTGGDPNTLSVNMVTQNEGTGGQVYTEIDSIPYDGSGANQWVYHEIAGIDPGTTYLQRMALSFKLVSLTDETTVYIDNVSLRQQ